MSTITREFTKDQLIEHAKKHIAHDVWLKNKFGETHNTPATVELARIALASLEAEPVGEVILGEYDDCGCYPDARVVCIAADGQADWQNFRDGARLYTAPPAPVSVPDEDLLHMAASAIEDLLSNKDRSGAGVWANIPAKLRRAAVLQGAEQQQNAQQNIPEIIPGGLVEAVNNLLNNDGSRGCYSAMECGAAREKIELWLAQRQKWEAQRSENLSAGNSPVIPDGYALVPIEPTTNQWAAGMQAFDSGMDKVTRVYKAMLTAAPQQEVK